MISTQPLEQRINFPRKSYLIEGDIPKICQQEDCCLGIDEAGRGPVLGPMVYGICVCPISKSDKLKGMKFADSKTLTESRREEFFEQIKSSKQKEWIAWAVKVLMPQDISHAMLRQKKYNLNLLSHDTAIELIRMLTAHGVKVKEIYVDTVGDPGKYQVKLQQLFPECKIIVCPKADSLYPIVSAASICAKVNRDRILKNWTFFETGMENSSRLFGSGYPGDPETKKWLKDHLDKVFGFPNIIRFSWSTCDELLKHEGYKVDWKLIEDPKKVNYFKNNKTMMNELVHKRKRDLSINDDDMEEELVEEYDKKKNNNTTNNNNSLVDSIYTEMCLEPVRKL